LLESTPTFAGKYTVPATCDLLVLQVVVERVDGKRFVCLSRSTPRLVGEYTTYSLKCLEVEFCELRHNGVLRSSLACCRLRFQGSTRNPHSRRVNAPVACTFWCIFGRQRLKTPQTGDIERILRPESIRGRSYARRSRIGFPHERSQDGARAGYRGAEDVP
jgi:hypothetical protein